MKLLPERPRGRRADDLVLAPLRRRDLREALAIEAMAHPKPWGKAVFESELRQVADGSRFYVSARQGRRLVGYAGLWIVHQIAPAEAHVTNLAVADSARRSGIGSRLLTALARHAVDRGCESWTLEVRASNSAAQELYRRFGFAPAGVRRHYYENTEDAIVMWCHAIQTEPYQERLAAVERRAAPARFTGGPW